MSVLDVGCGHTAKGNVNVDLFINHSIEKREAEHKIYNEWHAERKHKITNFVCADSNHLPFRNLAFDVVLCHHVLEHKGVNLLLTCKELLRVSKRKIVISVPSCLSGSAKKGLHDKIVTSRAFQILFKHYKIKMYYARYSWRFQKNVPTHILRHLLLRHKFKDKVPNPLHWLPCPIPNELRVEVTK